MQHGSHAQWSRWVFATSVRSPSPKGNQHPNPWPGHKFMSGEAPNVAELMMDSKILSDVPDALTIG